MPSFKNCLFNILQLLHYSTTPYTMLLLYYNYPIEILFSAFEFGLTIASLRAS